MRNAFKLAASITLCTLAIPTNAAARKGPSADQVGAWGACAAEKNADEVAWLYILQSGQSGLKGPEYYGAGAHAIFLVARDCVPEGIGFDNKLIKALSERSIAAWGGGRSKRSLPRAIDPWADCMARNHPEKSRPYLFARDIGFGGPKLIVQGVDPLDAVFAPTEKCESLKPASVESLPWIDLYARFNYRLRVEPRLRTTAAETVGARR